MNRKNIFIGLMLLGSFWGNAQDPTLFGKQFDLQKIGETNGVIRCASYEYEQYQRSFHQHLGTKEQFETWLAPKVQAYKNLMSQPQALVNEEIVTIPVVVHVLHNNKVYGVDENITDEQIFSQIEVLNQDYRRITGTPGYNDNSVGADVKVEFCLAQRTPDGQATNGINRINQTPPQGGYGIDLLNGSNIDAIKPATQWDPEQYLNVWVVDKMSLSLFGTALGEILGIAQFPQDSGLTGLDDTGTPIEADTDGVVIGAKHFGSQTLYPSGNYDLTRVVTGRTLTHEVGHYLGLRHIWGDTNDCNTDDFCPDTPNATDQLTTCTYRASCGVEEMKENYMNYTPEDCQNIFTVDQKARIRTVLANSPRRVSLATSEACLPPNAGIDTPLLHDIKLYPNPASSVLNVIIANGQLPDAYQLYNTLGQLIRMVKITTTNDLTLQIADLENGVYFIKVFQNNKFVTLRFVKS